MTVPCFRARAYIRSALIGCLAFCLLLSLSSNSRLYAQALAGLSGTVTDPSGAIVPDAKVTITNDATKVSTTATTSSAGTYSVTGLVPGVYTVKVEAKGFQTSSLTDVHVDVGKITTQNAALQTGEASQTVTVTESAIALNTTAPSLDTTIQNEVVQALPIEIAGRGRQIDNFIFLAPGVTGSTFSHRINGGVDFQNEVVFNGLPLVSSETQGYQTIINPPFDLINQFNVLRSSFSAQYGLAQGVITYQFTSGTNQLHGSAFEIARNDFFDARGAYNPTVPVDKEHNYGFSVGGPVILPKLYNGKNRTFFFATSEWYRYNQTLNTFSTVPTLAERQGDFSGIGTTIYDPTTGQPFPNNQIPTNRFSPLSASLLKYLPAPTTGGFTNNFAPETGIIPNRQTNWGFTIDHNINEKQALHYAEWRDNYSNIAQTNNYFPNGSVLAGSKFQPSLGTGFFLTYSNTITPNLVMTAGMSWAGEINNQFSLQENYSFPGVAGSVQLPTIYFNGPLSPTTWGTDTGWTQSINRKLGVSIANNWLWVHGKHTLNFGVELRRAYQDDNECQQCAGSFSFSNFTTANPNDLSSTGNSFASFLLGQADSAIRQQANELRLRNLSVSPYLQDDIKLTSRFTLNVGLRWDIMRPFTEVSNQVVFFDPNIPNPGAGGRLGAATKLGICDGCANYERAWTQWSHFSPRLGFTYQLNQKTVVQSGFSMNYLNGGAFEFGTNKVAVSYGNLLQGVFQRVSNNSNIPGYGSWDAQVMPFPTPAPFSPNIGNGATIHAFNRNADTAPYITTWNAGIQRELPWNLFFTGTYVGNKVNHLPSALNPFNQLDPAYLAQYGSLLGQPVTSVPGAPIPYPGFLTDFPGASLQQALRPYPQYANIINNFDQTGAARYNAMQLTGEKRFTNGLSFLVSYTLSKSMSNTNSGFSTFANNSLNKQNQKAEWSIDNNDQTNNLRISGTYELPFGPGKPFLNKRGVVGQIVGGWQISPILTYATGTPLFQGTGGSVNVPGDPLANKCSDCNRANVIAGVPQMFDYNNVYKGQSVLNPAAFSNPGLWALGNAPRVLSGVRNPFQSSEDIAVSKSFGTERYKFELRMDYFNVLNRVIFGSPVALLTDPDFGKVINNQANTQRQGQAQLRFTF